jgi:rhomboid protease GluP
LEKKAPGSVPTVRQACIFLIFHIGAVPASTSEKLVASYKKICMPEKTQTLIVDGYGARRLQAIAFGALLQLEWTVKYAGNNTLVSYIHKTLKGYDSEITIQASDDHLTVTSKMPGEKAGGDETGKDVSDFVDAFETIKAKANDEEIEAWDQRVSVIEEETVKLSEQEVKQIKEVDSVMNLSTANRYITYAIIVVNALVFIMMAISGVNAFNPTGVDIINWGGNYGTLTLSGDWWRLITNIFVHIGIIHIAFNMYALFMVGVYLEPMLGKIRYLAAYLCTGIFASLTSLWWHKDPVASAGASGAIFGLYGVFLALLSTNLVPKHIRNSLLQSIGIFIAYNLIYGMRSGVDNAAHVGGLLSGLVIGYIYYLELKRPGKKPVVIAAVLLLVTLAAAFLYLNQNKLSQETRMQAKEKMKEYDFSDASKYDDQFTKIVESEKKAMEPLQRDNPDPKQVELISLPAWDTAVRAAELMKTYKVSEKAMKKAAMLENYVEFRKQQTHLWLDIQTRGDSLKIPEYFRIRMAADSILRDLNSNK